MRISRHPKLNHSSSHLAAFIIGKFATVAVALSMLCLSVFWILWNAYAPLKLTFDTDPGLPRYMEFATAIALFISPFMLISNQLQENSADERHSQLMERIEDLEKMVHHYGGEG
jgi:uncharacterized membrane protein